MRGPGGVGTLSGKNVRKPGPSQDGLNAWAKKHIPGLAIDSLPSASLVGGETAHFGFDGAEPPVRPSAAVASSAGGAGLGLENAVAAAAAIEGWVRRLAIKSGPGTPRMTGRGATGGGAGVGSGGLESDLIELLDGAGSDDGRGFELSPGSSRAAIGGGGGIGGISGIEDLVRGGGGSKGKKSD